MTIRHLSQVYDEHLFFRIDSEHCQKAYLANVARIRSWPSGWVKLGDEAIEITGGATPLGADYPTFGVKFLRVQNVMQNFIDDADMTYINSADDETLSRSRLQLDDVLLTITGVSYGKAAVVTPEFVDSNINQHSVRIRLKSSRIRPYFLSTFLNAMPGKLQSDQNVTGVTRPALDYSTIRSFSIPFYSDGLQSLIEIAVRNAYESFDKAKVELSNAEQILLRALDLDNWRPSEPLTYSRSNREAFASGRFDAEHFKPKFSELEAHIRATDSFTNLEDLLAINARGTQPDYTESGLPVINSKHVANTEVRLNEDNRLATPTNNSLRIKQGDVLMNGTGVGTIGRTAPYLHDSEALPDNHVTVLRPKDGSIDPVYLSIFFEQHGRAISSRQMVSRLIRSD